MDFFKAIELLLESLPILEDEKVLVRDKLGSIKNKITQNPSDKNDANEIFLNIILLLLFEQVESLYGKCDDAKICFQPQFKGTSGSTIASFLQSEGEKDRTFCVVIAERSSNNWEDVFYELSHEAVHLLNPIVDKNKIIVSSLEEGVAVKFAEKIYEKYISPYTNKGPNFSPVAWGGNRYADVFHAAKKIPDEKLKDIRGKFGKFYGVYNREDFKNMVYNYLNETEINLLITPFKYRDS